MSDYCCSLKHSGFNTTSFIPNTNLKSRLLQSSGTRVQAMDDGFMEVVGLFGAAQMAALQVGDTGIYLSL